MVDFARARLQMVDTQLRPQGITDRALIAAMGAVPREKFVPGDRAALAYVDDKHRLSSGPVSRYMPAPATFAKLVQLAGVVPGDVVLDVACGTGYSTAVLASLASTVVAIEEDSGLVGQANAILGSLDIGNAAVLEAPLDAGVPREAPFDVILVQGAVEAIPQGLLDQLREGGRLVTVILKDGSSVAQICIRTAGIVGCRLEFDASLPALAAFKTPAEFIL